MSQLQLDFLRIDQALPVARLGSVAEHPVQGSFFVLGFFLLDHVVGVEGVEGGCPVDGGLPELEGETQVLHLVEEEEIVEELLVVIVGLALGVYAELA